jgi:O-succinylbenzoate synthase
MLWRGDAGWAEWSPFEDYHGAEVLPWLRAADEAAELGWPPPVRSEVTVNCTIPAVGPAEAHRLAVESGCRTAKVKVAEPGQSLGADLDRVEAVRAALGRDGRVRVDANGGWDLEAAERSVVELSRFELEYVEQPCAAVEDLATLRLRLARRHLDLPIAADESIRRAADPWRVARLQAADIAVLKVQPLGGVRACLQLAEQIGLPVVVSSALETSVGIRAGLALAAALPELPYDCGLNTVPLLTGDVTTASLVAQAGVIAVRAVTVDPAALVRHEADLETRQRWQARLEATRLEATRATTADRR